MTRMSSLADKHAIESAMPWDQRVAEKTLHAFLSATATSFPDRPAVSFQLLSGPRDKAETYTWAELLGRVNQTANMFRALGVGEKDVVAYLLPNASETVFALLGGAIAGVVNPINPLLEPEQIASILRETGARVLVTLRAFPRTDVARKAAAAVALAPGVETVLEVDLLHYLTPPRSWIVPFMRPGSTRSHSARVLDFRSEMARHPADRLTFPDAREDRVAACFHTGGTTGMPKVVRHRYSGMIYNGWVA
ncbi:MAG: AMP-binding protein, partial [Rhodobacteraceae bacterium]|nr:AMP-binding protein [Paracoccaceae bacterium]